ncbi:MAG: 6-bladed beta-propeller [Bacteroides sp.]|nr:6-bladed beta-propeller [Bacteroides sp.]
MNHLHFFLHSCLFAFALTMFVILIYGCASIYEKSQYFVDPKSTVGPESIFDGWSYVTLETNDKNLISSMDKVMFDNDKIYILDRKVNEVFIFDRRGRYLNKIAKQGQGRDEYLDIDDVNVYKSNIFILCSDTKTIMQYSPQGSFIKSIPLPDSFYRFSFIGDNKLCLYSSFSNNLKYNLILYNYQTKQIIAHYYPFEKNKSFIINWNFIQSEKYGTFVAIPFDLTIYKLRKDGLSPYAEILLGKNNIIPDNYQNVDFLTLADDFRTKSIIYDFNFIYVNDDYLYLNYIFEFRSHLSLIDLKSKGAKTVILDSYKGKRLPYIYAGALGFDKNRLVSYLTADRVIKDNPKFRSDKNADSLLHEDDNPVLFFHQLKVRNEWR